ncbi:hypothetical protein TNCV_3568661 [Trichonephila clavipes]|nr:hypothetical protein TNCV_3568661 [Trichonephila clavipes]
MERKMTPRGKLATPTPIPKLAVTMGVTNHFRIMVLMFVQTRRMPNSSSQMIPDMLDWRQIWESGRPWKGSNCPKTVL